MGLDSVVRRPSRNRSDKPDTKGVSENHIQTTRKHQNWEKHTYFITHIDIESRSCGKSMISLAEDLDIVQAKG